MKKVSKYGIKIKNFQAGSLYQCNIGVRKNYDYTKAMFANNLLMYYLLDNGLKVENGWTRDIVCIEFDYGSRSYEEETEHLDKMIEKDDKYSEEVIDFFKDLKQQADLNKHLFDKKSVDEIREIFYQNGVEIRHDIKNKKGKTIKEEITHYKMLYRSTGKAKKGSCMFICDRLYDKAIKFLRMGLKLPKENAPIVEMSAYSSLIASSIVDTIRINPKNILILKDIDSFFSTNVISVETDEYKHCIAVPKENYQLKNTMFDGQGLIDESIFPKWGEGYILLRHHMCKMACFKTKIQKFFKDYYGDNYNTATVKDMFGNDHYVKDIELITTDNAMKWLKFDVSYDYWCNKVYENGCQFGIVKTAHKSKLGDVQKMSYQMINTLDIDIMPNVVQKSVEYIEQLKGDNEVFLQYLRDNKNFSNDYEVLVALCEQNMDFTRSEYFRSRKRKIIESYVKNFKFGKVIQDADNLVFVGSPYAMLLYTVGEDVENDSTFSQEKDAIQCFTQRFDDGEYLACFRSPHNSQHNISHLHNVYSEEYFKYFDFGRQIIALNTLHTDIQDRLNGCDFDSDSGYITNQKNIVECAKNCYLNYPTIVNNIPKDKNKYDNTLLSHAIVDNKLAQAQMAIGSSSNLAQVSITYSYNFDDQKYKDYVCILSVLAQVAIDNAKRTFDIDLESEIDRIKVDMCVSKYKYPTFWLNIRKDFNKKHDELKKYLKDVIELKIIPKEVESGEKTMEEFLTKLKSDIKKKDRINRSLKCPMNYLCDLKLTKQRNENSTLPMSHFFNKYELETNRRQSKKVEELIEKYSLDLYDDWHSKVGTELEEDALDENSLLLRSDFDQLIEDIKKVYISKNYVGLMSWLIDRAFGISQQVQNHSHLADRKTNENKALLLKVLYDINPQNVLQIFSKNA